MFNLSNFLTLISSLPNPTAYFLLALSAFVENVFPPIPGDTITAFGAFLVGTGKLSFPGVYLSTTLGSLLGFLTLFWLGKYLGRRFFVEKDYRYFKAKDIVRAEHWFEKYGYLIVGLNRFLPGIRSIISLSAGMSGLKTKWVALFSFVSCAVWNLIWILMGRALGTHWNEVGPRMSAIMGKYRTAILILCALFLIFLLGKKFLERKKAEKI
ncbi:MAG: DedA family protein [Deltaproteobacteria bacterium]|nr:DedA family protein [Deltaproteobacteria bacterium]MBW1919034.1 DedA family protein [Deltaproteobacteria bacterium]MBW1934526.1 DedA family protein [Deltaproteobacteria bacterium]MBW1977031.1 DedA family protein [Deltaproteobacteria bacterium]MBW2046727.1 DedA family protein [Deltaproteobacteria bacterium]